MRPRSKECPNLWVEITLMRKEKIKPAAKEITACLGFIIIYSNTHSIRVRHICFMVKFRIIHDLFFLPPPINFLRKLVTPESSSISVFSIRPTICLTQTAGFEVGFTIINGFWRITEA